MTRTAYSYTRFSSKPQEWGTSKLRQDAMVAAWLRRNPEYALDTKLSLHDAGVSAYRGANRKKGKLGVFLKAIEQGKVEPGSALLVENWDRFTRECPYDADPILRSIFSAGITIVNLEEDESFDEATVRDDYRKYRGILDDIDRSHRQSERLGKLISGMWEVKRQTASSKPLTTRGPDWLWWDGSKWVEKPEMVAAVRQLFEWKAEGIGGETINRWLNRDYPGVRPKGWYRGYCERIVRNRAVLGEFTPTKNGKPCQPLPNYFPQIVSLELWNRVQAITDRNAELPGNGGGVKGPINNLFRDIVRCGRCGAAMRYQNKSASPKRGHSQYLRCSRARRGFECDGSYVRYDRLEPLVLCLCRTLPVAELLTNAREQDSINKRRRTLQDDLAAVNKEFEKLFKLAKLAKNDAALEKLAAELDAVGVRKAELGQELETIGAYRFSTTDAINQHLASVEDLITRMETLVGAERTDLRHRLHQELLQIIDRIEVTPKDDRALSVMVAFRDLPAILLLMDADGGVRLMEEDGDISRIDRKGNEVPPDPERQRRINAKVAAALRRRGFSLLQISRTPASRAAARAAGRVPRAPRESGSCSPPGGAIRSRDGSGRASGPTAPRIP